MRYSAKTFSKKMRYKRKHWDYLIDSVIEKGLENEILSEIWSFKDVICHVTWYDKELVKALDTKSIVGSNFWNVSVSQRNDTIFNDTQKITLDEILKESKATFNTLVKKIEALKDEDLNSDEYIKRKSDKRITWDFIGANNFWHFEDHEDALVERFDLDY